MDKLIYDGKLKRESKHIIQLMNYSDVYHDELIKLYESFKRYSSILSLDTKLLRSLDMVIPNTDDYDCRVYVIDGQVSGFFVSGSIDGVAMCFSFYMHSPVDYRTHTSDIIIVSKMLTVEHINNLYPDAVTAWSDDYYELNRDKWYDDCESNVNQFIIDGLEISTVVTTYTR